MFRFLQDVSISPRVAWEHSQFETMRKKKTYRHLESPQEQWLVVKMLRAFSPHLSECQQLSLYSPYNYLCILRCLYHTPARTEYTFGVLAQSRKFSYQSLHLAADTFKMNAGFSKQITCLALPSLSFLLTILYFVYQSSPEEKKRSRAKIYTIHVQIHSISRERKRFFLGTGYTSKFGKLSSGHRTGKGQFSFQSQRKAMPKNAQTTIQLHSSHTLVK